MRLFSRRAVTVGAGLAAVTAVIASICIPAAAAPVTYTVTTDPVQAAAGWVATQFVDKTDLPAPDGDHFIAGQAGSTFFPNYGENADVIFGLAAAKTAGAKINTALRYLAANADAYADFSKKQGGPYDGNIGKLALAAAVAGADPHRFGGHDLLKQLQDDECTGAVKDVCAAPGAARNIFSSVSESLVVLAEVRGGVAPSSAALTYLTSLQCADGGFGKDPTPCGSGAADLDATSYGIMALAAGGHTTEIDKAIAWLKSQQQPGGYWISQNVPNANSTGLAVAALQSQGVDVRKARAWLLSQQVPAGRAGAGAIKFGGTITATTKSATSPSVIATAQALTGLVDGGSLATVTAAGARAAVPVFAPAATLSAHSAHPGARFTVTGAGFVAGEKLQVSIHSTPTTVATATATGLGTARVTVIVPTTLDAGTHAVVVTGTSSGLSASQQVTLVAVVTPTSAAPTAAAVVSSAAPEPATPTLAATGQNGHRLAALSVVGIAAVLAGAALLFLGRRRRLD